MLSLGIRGYKIKHLFSMYFIKLETSFRLIIVDKHNLCINLGTKSQDGTNVSGKNTRYAYILDTRSVVMNSLIEKRAINSRMTMMFNFISIGRLKRIIIIAQYTNRLNQKFHWDPMGIINTIGFKFGTNLNY